jgi:hypothetical protein
VHLVGFIIRIYHDARSHERHDARSHERHDARSHERHDARSHERQTQVYVNLGGCQSRSNEQTTVLIGNRNPGLCSKSRDAEYT